MSSIDVGAVETSAPLSPTNRLRGLVGFGRDVMAYGLASAIALAVDWGALVVQTRGFGAPYFTAAAVSFSLGIVVIYFLSVAVVFKGRRRLDPREEFVGFLVTGIVGLAVNQACLYGFVEYARLDPVIAKAPTTGLVFLFNFLSRRMMFTPRTSR